MRWMGYALPVIATAAVMLRVGTMPEPLDFAAIPSAIAAPTLPAAAPRDHVPSPAAQRAATIFNAARAYDATPETLETLVATSEYDEQELADAAIAIGAAYIASFEAPPAEQERAEIVAMHGRAEILRGIARVYHDDLDAQRFVVEQLDALAVTIESRGLPVPTSGFRAEARGVAAETVREWTNEPAAWALVGAMAEDVDTLLAMRAYHRCAQLDPASDCPRQLAALRGAYRSPLPPDLR
jgi:hypothetical protein